MNLLFCSGACHHRERAFCQVLFLDTKSLELGSMSLKSVTQDLCCWSWQLRPQHADLDEVCLKLRATPLLYSTFVRSFIQAHCVKRLPRR